MNTANAATSAAGIAGASLENSIKQADIEDRPILWATEELGVPFSDGSFGGHVWNWKIRNYGKTPAMDVTIHQEVGLSRGFVGCWKDDAPPGMYWNFKLPSPITPNGIHSDSYLYPVDYFPDGMALLRRIPYRGEFRLRLTATYRDLQNITHSTFICLENSGTRYGPNNKVILCEDTESTIDEYNSPKKNHPAKPR